MASQVPSIAENDFLDVDNGEQTSVLENNQPYGNGHIEHPPPLHFFPPFPVSWPLYKTSLASPAPRK